jgi:ABC-type transport system substrate-binding protein
MNTQLVPFDDVRVRQAVNYATDRAKVIATYGALNARITCQDLPPNSQGYVPYCPYTVDPGSGQWTGPDMARAEELIRQAHVQGTHVTVWILDSYGPALVAQARYFADLLTKLHLPATVHVEPDFRTFSRSVYVSPSKVQFAFDGWIADYSAASNFIATQFTCDSIHRDAPGGNQNGRSSATMGSTPRCTQPSRRTPRTRSGPGSCGRSPTTRSSTWRLPCSRPHLTGSTWSPREFRTTNGARSGGSSSTRCGCSDLRGGLRVRRLVGYGSPPWR